MRQFSIVIPAGLDIPAIVSSMLNTMGSLSAPHWDWARLLHGIGLRVGLESYPNLKPISPVDAAALIIDGARKALNFAPHQMATAYIGDKSVTLKTIRGVVTNLVAREDGLFVFVDFHRESKRLASNMMSVLVRFGVPGAAAYVAEVAREAALLEAAVP